MKRSKQGVDMVVGVSGVSGAEYLEQNYLVINAENFEEGIFLKGLG